MVVTEPVTGQSTALELKYLTAFWQGEDGGETFDLLNHAAQDIRAYDCIKDIAPVEEYIAGRQGAAGAVVVLTNDPSYWTLRSHGHITNAHEFRIHQGTAILGTRS
jgi:hypothetical protein